VTLEAPYFDRLYGTEPDPWEFRSRPYEIRKRALTLACLPSLRYSTAFEPGCSIGVLTSDLASRCDRVLSMDLSALALASAGETVPPNVELRQGAVPGDWPAESFELVVLSEVGYYLDADDCRCLGERAAAGTTDLVIVHWRHPVDDYPLSGDEVHRILAETSSQAGMTHLVEHTEHDFRLDVWSHDARSVALRTGVPHQSPTQE
jgi:Nodulation protein S (NodS)